MNTSLVTPKSNSKNRKISLQPLTNTPNNGNLSFNNDHYNSNGYYRGNNNRSRTNNSSFTSPNTYSDNIIMNNPSSPITHFNYSPKQVYYSSKSSSKPTLFDFISTPIKSPKHANCNILEPLKALPETSIMSPSVEKIAMKLSLLNNHDDHPENLFNNENKEIPKALNQIDLGISVKNALNDFEMKKLDVIANIYSQLILSN